MVDISVEKYTNAKVCTITVSNKKLFWVRIYDVQKEIGVKNMSNLVRKAFVYFSTLYSQQLFLLISQQ